MIRTTVVGSWPIPPQLKPQLTAYYRGEVSDGDAHDVLGAAARIAMDEQLACGLDQIMGGEVFAPDFVHHVPPRLAGLKCLARRDHRVGYEGIGTYQIQGDLGAPRGTGHALAYRREKAVEPRLEKAAVPSPLTMSIPFFADPRREEQMENVARVVEAEVLDMIAAGVREVQLDAPAEAVALTMNAQSADEILRWLLFPLRNAAGITRTVHFCLGDMGRRPFTQEQNLRALLPVLRRLEGHVDRVHLECTYAGQWEERHLLREVPRGLEVIAGIADVKGAVAPAGVLRDRVAALAAILPPERLLVSSSCGCGRCTPEQANTLMSNLVAAAHAVS